MKKILTGGGVALIATLLITGCSPMKIEEFAASKPALKLEEYFEGETVAWGIFEDRFGNLKRSFQVDIKGSIVEGNLVLEEDFVYNDGETDRRVWTITPLGKGHYQGKADDIVGTATGKVAGNALNWQYTMDLPVGESTWRVKFNDWMFLQPGEVMINKAHVSKWGINIGTVTLFFSKHTANSETRASQPLEHVENE
jgi:hypothetical protein